MRPANPEVLRVLVLAGAGAPVTPPLLPTGSFTVAIASLEPRSAGLDLLTSTACDALIVEGVEDMASIREIVALRPDVPVLVVDSSGYQTAALIREGADDVLVRDELTASALARALAHAVARRQYHPRDIEAESEAVLRTHGDGLELLIVMMRLSARGPVEHDVRGGHEFDLHHAGVQRMFAGIERCDPNTFVTLINEVAMFEIQAADIHVRHADVGDHHTDVANRNLHHRHLLDLREPRIEIPRAGQEDLFLQAASPTAIQERLSILEIVVASNGRPGNFSRID